MAAENLPAAAVSAKAVRAWRKSSNDIDQKPAANLR